MEKIFVLSKDASFSENIKNYINKEKYIISEPAISARDLFTYCCNFKPMAVLIHTSYLQGFYRVFDLLISSKKCLVLYFSSMMELGSVYNVITSPLFYMLEENRVQCVNEIMDLMLKDTQIISQLEDRLDKYKEKMEEEKMIRKAKLAIMNIRGCSEDEAYRTILKKSMDERISKALAAKKIISEVEK